MQRAGAASAGEIALRCRDRLRAGALVFAGPGNNGGDAWVVARALATTGVRVRVCEPASAATEDARAERELALPLMDATLDSEALSTGDPFRGEGIVIDGLLGTGASGAPRGALGAAARGLRAMRDRGAAIIALDLPTGVDATTGVVTTATRADLCITYGTLKRGHVLARAACGRIVVVDIGLGEHAALDDGAPMAVGGRWVAATVPEFTPDLHKGTRRKLAIVGGGAGMSGAAILAARAAWRSGIGMVKLVVAGEMLHDVREADPQSLTAPWPARDADVETEIGRWADIVAIGPGLGGGAAARETVERILRVYPGPVVLDADALNAFASDVNALAGLLAGRPAVLTPHPAEFARLTGVAVDDVLARRFDVALPLARHTRAVVLLKGQPTIVTAPSGDRLVSASGTPLLAAAGSGDLLTGMVATLLGQMRDPLVAAACAAWVHGRAAWLAQRAPDGGAGSARGLTLDDAMRQLPRAWPSHAGPSRHPVLFELPAIV
jgi:NAD(P)H-hydrate epimerase